MIRVAFVAALAVLQASAVAHPNPYHILGVSRTDSVDEFKTAFRNLAKKWHPDKSASPELFARLREAYDILMDADKRNYYDRIGRYPPAQQSHIAVDIQDHAIQRYAALGALHLYHRDPDRFSPSTLLIDETYPLLVEDDVARFGTVWIVKLYSNHCSGCAAISSAWESLLNEYQGWASFGRINYDLSAGLVRALDLRAIPEIFAVTRSRDDSGVTLTPLLNGDLNRLSKRSFAQILSSVPRPNDFTIIDNRNDYDKFIESNGNRVKIIFASRSHRYVPVSLSAFMFRRDLPKSVQYAFVGRNVDIAGLGTSTEAVLVRRGENEETISELSDWDRLISVDSGAWLVPILAKNSLPLFPKLTYDNYYDICYVNDPACIVVVTDQESSSLRYFAGLQDLTSKMKYSDIESRFRIGWIHGSEQNRFVQQLGLASSFREHKVGFGVVRPTLQTFQAFSGPGSNPNDFSQVQAWIAAAVRDLLESDDLKQSAIPFLQPEPAGSSSFFSSKFAELSLWVWHMFTVLLYCFLALAAIFLLFIGPSLM